MKLSKNIYLQTFGIVVIILALYRCAFLNDSSAHSVQLSADAGSTSSESLAPDTITSSDITGLISADRDSASLVTSVSTKANAHAPTQNSAPLRSSAVHPIYSVPSYKKSFPDNQEAHMQGVSRWGVAAVGDRAEAEHRKSDLVFIGASPYYTVDRLNRSIPYLVPRAALLLHDLGRNYFDSLYVKGIPLHRFIVTSALRTKSDVKTLQQHNVNATENSCHLYGTTFDVCYNRYTTVSNPHETPRRAVQNDTLKWILSEVLRDMRESGRCYVKYEVKQSCFHITVK